MSGIIFNLCCNRNGESVPTTDDETSSSDVDLENLHNSYKPDSVFNNNLEILSNLQTTSVKPSIPSSLFKNILDSLHNNPDLILNMDMLLYTEEQIQMAARAVFYEMVVNAKCTSKVKETYAFVLDLFTKDSTTEEFDCFNDKKLYLKDSGLSDAKKAVQAILKTSVFDSVQMCDALNKVRSGSSEYDLKILIPFLQDESIAQDILQGQAGSSKISTSKNLSLVLLALHSDNLKLAKMCVVREPKLLYLLSQEHLNTQEFEELILDEAVETAGDVFEKIKVSDQLKNKFYNSFDCISQLIFKKPTFVLLAGNTLRQDRQQYGFLLQRAFAKIYFNDGKGWPYYIIATQYKIDDVEEIQRQIREILPKETKIGDLSLLENSNDLEKERTQDFKKWYKSQFFLSGNDYIDFVHGLYYGNFNKQEPICNKKTLLSLLDIPEVVHCICTTALEAEAQFYKPVASRIIQLHSQNMKIHDDVCKLSTNSLDFYYSDLIFGKFLIVESCLKEYDPIISDLLWQLFKKYGGEAVLLPQFPKPLTILHSNVRYPLLHLYWLDILTLNPLTKDQSNSIKSVFYKIVCNKKPFDISPEQKQEFLEKIKQNLGKTEYKNLLELLVQYKKCREIMRYNLHELLCINEVSLEELSHAARYADQWWCNSQKETWDDAQGIEFGFTPAGVLKYNSNKEVVTKAEEIMKKLKDNAS